MNKTGQSGCEDVKELELLSLVERKQCSRFGETGSFRQSSTYRWDWPFQSAYLPMRNAKMHPDKGLSRFIYNSPKWKQLLTN